MLTIASALVATACVVASARRLAWVVLLTGLDPKLLAHALRGKYRADWRRLRDAIATSERAVWERDLLGALDLVDQPSRVALVNEQLSELDWRTQRWASVPRVCARVSTSAGFLFACLALMRGMSHPTGEAVAALVPALDALALGIAGMSFCVAVHSLARRAVTERFVATEKLVEQLEALMVST